MAEISDLINAVADKKPLDFAKNMNELMQDRVSALVADRKYDIAASFFAGKNVYEPENAPETETETETDVEETNDGEATA